MNTLIFLLGFNKGLYFVIQNYLVTLGNLVITIRTLNFLLQKIVRSYLSNTHLKYIFII